MACLDPKASNSPVGFPRSVGDDARSIIVAYILARLCHYIPGIKRSNQRAEGWGAATDYAILAPFHKKLVSLYFGSFRLLHPYNVSFPLKRPLGLQTYAFKT